MLFFAHCMSSHCVACILFLALLYLCRWSLSSRRRVLGRRTVSLTPAGSCCTFGECTLAMAHCSQMFDHKLRWIDLERRALEVSERLVKHFIPTVNVSSSVLPRTNILQPSGLLQRGASDLWWQSLKCERERRAGRMRGRPSFPCQMHALQLFAERGRGSRRCSRGCSSCGS
jgi:hypothetical protein